MAVRINLDVIMARRKIGVSELAERIGITPANVSILKNGRAKAIRFTTLDALCRALDCQPGDILEWVPDGEAEG
ncbi:helix-turn-helix domain-containing protein [Bifidobacterium avesanii]|uniref:Helix-turn-helix domain-containing protein n=1 Tax=Bifidobacterium avesanii TaxID=1798157 RepID=A0A7K3TED7_9BIFI|nr:helix-turn-helix transcriptional regulator [Bifidobacterium avesanii]KAB8295396.1 XRE family transcriptional regulator [Bifidobacterium avesanii]NEG77402.1 helix-turn-helix domain-containing protein [Bifidobacterium avesanii]